MDQLRITRMQEARSFLANEIKKPVRALYSMLRWLAKQIALYMLRFVLWSLFFVLPGFVFAFLAFHWFTGKVRNEIQHVNTRTSSVRYAPVQSSQVPSGFSTIRTLSEDLRFWVRELERFRS